MIKIINNRNTLLIAALVAGILGSNLAIHIKPFTLYILAIVMVFSTTSFQMNQLKDYKYFSKTTAISFILNYIVFGLFLLVPAYFLINEKALFWGFVVIAATPPGIAIIPFSFIFKGDERFSLIGVLGVYLLAIIASPLIVEFFIKDVSIDSTELFLLTVKIIVIPILLSRLLLYKSIQPAVQKIRGKVVNWGFAIIIYTIIGINKDAIFSDWEVVLKSSLILFVVMFVSGILFELITRKKIIKAKRISMNLMLTTKSSGYAAATALVLFGDRSALPAAFLSIFVLLYLITFEFMFKKSK